MAYSFSYYLPLGESDATQALQYITGECSMVHTKLPEQFVLCETQSPNPCGWLSQRSAAGLQIAKILGAEDSLRALLFRDASCHIELNNPSSLGNMRRQTPVSDIDGGQLL